MIYTCRDCFRTLIINDDLPMSAAIDPQMGLCPFCCHQRILKLETLCYGEDPDAGGGKEKRDTGELTSGRRESAIPPPALFKPGDVICVHGTKHPNGCDACQEAIEAMKRGADYHVSYGDPRDVSGPHPCARCGKPVSCPQPEQLCLDCWRGETL